MLTPNVILSAVEGSLQQQTRCLHYGRHDIYAFFSIWVNCYIITYFYQFCHSEPQGGISYRAGF